MEVPDLMEVMVLTGYVSLVRAGCESHMGEPPPLLVICPSLLALTILSPNVTMTGWKRSPEPSACPLFILVGPVEEKIATSSDRVLGLSCDPKNWLPATE